MQTNLYDRQQISGCLGRVSRGGVGKLLKAMDMVTILMLVKVSWRYTYVKTHQSVPLKYTVCYVKYMSIKLFFFQKYRLYINIINQSFYN